RHPLEQAPAEVAQAPFGVAEVARLRVDPHLLQLHGARRPRRGLGLEEDRAVLLPEPGAALVDLDTRAPAEALRIPLEGVDSDLLPVRRRAGRQQEVEVVELRRP